MSPQSKYESMWMGISDTNWVQIGLKWVRFHFSKKSKSVKPSMFNGGFTFFELGSFSRFCVFSSMTMDPVWGMGGQEKKRFSSFSQSPFAKATAGQGLRRTGIKKEVGFSRIYLDFCEFVGVFAQFAWFFANSLGFWSS
jgi:hypothetical protein